MHLSSPLPLPSHSPHTTRHGTPTNPNEEAIPVNPNPGPGTQTHPNPNPGQPIVGMGTIHATSADDPESGEQASVRIEGSDTWYPALVPMHAPRGSRTPSAGAVPVVGCLVDNDRFVLSWADMRCRPVSTNASFPAECDGGTQRNVTVENTTAAISFVESLKQGARRSWTSETPITPLSWERRPRSW